MIFFLIQNVELITDFRVDASLLTTNLKRLNRLSQIRGKVAKEKTQEASLQPMIVNHLHKLLT
jgi:hypothetical protein